MVGCRHPQGCHRQRSRLTPTWAPQGAIQCRYRDHHDVLRADAPPQARWATPHRMGAHSRQTARRLPRGTFRATRRPGETPVFMKPPSRGAWRCKRGRGRSLPGRADEPRRWQARRAETGLAAAVGHRHAAAAAWDGKRKGVNGHSRSTCCGSARLAQRGDGSPITTQLPHARPGRVLRPRGAVDRASRARLVSMPCRVGSRADGAKATAARHRVQRKRCARPAVTVQ